jgi:FkbM family methyltransferase
MPPPHSGTPSAMMMQILSKAFPRLAGRKARRDLLSIKLPAGDIAIDCGANVGDITHRLASRGATVFAFEPNPHAFRVLQERLADAPNVYCFPLAVGVESCRMRLYLHERSDEDEVYWSTGSSLLEFKGNVLKGKFEWVEVVDLCPFIESLNHQVRVLKLDVEGVECAILRKPIDTGLVGRIDRIFAETHDRKIPELRAETDALRDSIVKAGIKSINLSWG